MTFLEAAILGLIQGATEFLPISSSGHLVMGQALLGLQLPGVGFEVALHLATLVSVLLVYRRRVGSLMVGAARMDPAAWRYLGLLVVASAPVALVGLGVRTFVEGLFELPWVAGGALVVTGTLLWSAKGALARKPERQPGFREALLMGFAQVVALVPGISRSGITVVTGLWLGVEAEEAAAFSFLMALPAIAGASLLLAPAFARGDGGLDVAPLILGSAVAAAVGILAIWAFVGMLKRRSFHRFGPYCSIVGGLFLLYLFMRG
jgi:undecaprenyl-diphosphatase